MKPVIYVTNDVPAAWLGINGPEKAVLVSLVSHLNPGRSGTEVWPSAHRIAAQTGFGVKTVRRALNRLSELQLIKSRQHTGKTNIYSVNVDAISAAADLANQQKSYPHPGQRVQGQEADPGQRVQGTLVRESTHPGHSDHRTANRTAKGNSRVSSVGCSIPSRVLAPPSQRELPVHGLVETADASKVSADTKKPADSELSPDEARAQALSIGGRNG